MYLLLQLVPSQGQPKADRKSSRVYGSTGRVGREGVREERCTPLGRSAVSDGRVHVDVVLVGHFPGTNRL